MFTGGTGCRPTTVSLFWGPLLVGKGKPKQKEQAISWVSIPIVSKCRPEVNFEKFAALVDDADPSTLPGGNLGSQRTEGGTGSVSILPPMEQRGSSVDSRISEGKSNSDLIAGSLGVGQVRPPVCQSEHREVCQLQINMEPQKGGSILHFDLGRETVSRATALFVKYASCFGFYVSPCFAKAVRTLVCK